MLVKRLLRSAALAFAQPLAVLPSVLSAQRHNCQASEGLSGKVFAWIHSWQFAPILRLFNAILRLEKQSVILRSGITASHLEAATHNPALHDGLDFLPIAFKVGKIALVAGGAFVDRAATLNALPRGGVSAEEGVTAGVHFLLLYSSSALSC